MRNRFIMTSGKEAKTIGYLIPNLYGFHGMRIGIKEFGLRYLLDIFKGRMYWWVDNDTDYESVVDSLKELRKTHSFNFYYWRSC